MLYVVRSELYNLLIIKNVYENITYMTYKKWRKILNIFSGICAISNALVIIK